MESRSSLTGQSLHLNMNQIFTQHYDLARVQLNFKPISSNNVLLNLGKPSLHITIFAKSLSVNLTLILKKYVMMSKSMEITSKRQIYMINFVIKSELFHDVKMYIVPSKGWKGCYDVKKYIIISRRTS